MQKKLAEKPNEIFSIRIKLGEYEVELSGTHHDVMRAVERLPTFISNVNKAFQEVRPKTIAKITVKTTDSEEAVKPSETKAVSIPKIGSTNNTQDAVLLILESDWGKWRPRTVE
ncbi:MAG: hypothetical protein GX638_08585, partial [Crenarchaeota archaeon]|nr:hypothetical protein [Thermoproteota archaeon]